VVMGLSDVVVVGVSKFANGFTERMSGRRV
jgi:hypothetical protein